MVSRTRAALAACFLWQCSALAAVHGANGQAVAALPDAARATVKGHITSNPLPAFPGAEGFGAAATGGRGGAVYHVKNLDDSGPGSFRDAVSRGPRMVVFDVGGCIRIQSELHIASDITVAGQTAPGPGITIYGNGTSLSQSHNVIVRYMRFRQGIKSGKGVKAVTMGGSSNIIFDHISVQWGRWDTFGASQNSSKITLQNSIIGEGIDPQRFGGFFDAIRNVTLSHNLWIDNQSRNPKAKGNLQYINNVVYNWGASGVTGGHSAAPWHQDFINNVFIKGPSSTDKFLDLFASTDNVYQAGNLADLDRDGILVGRPVVESDYHGATPPTFQTAPYNHPAIPITVDSPADAYRRIVASAGDSLVRDAVDTRLIAQLTSLGTQGAIIHEESAVGGQPDVSPDRRPAGFDSGADGIPDDWERQHGLNPNDPSDANGDFDEDGYTNVEKYINSLVHGG